MGKINVLDFEIANLIAAGEVVERPSSVLKELIENSIDSGATKIVAEIKRGGVSLIRVTDNGCGMDKDDLPVALKRHATSKIRSKDDLEAIMTLGFRGEALAAIASVSELTIITKTRESDTAYMLTSEAGRVVEITDVGAADGTTVVVENLFFNVPARRKFLKKDSTEAMNVAALVERVALSKPEISIQLLIDGEMRFKTSGDGDLQNAIYAVFGKEFASKLIKADGEADGIHTYGYIGRSDNVRKNRNLQNVFINGRYVKSLTAMAAIEKAYTSYIAPECFPSCVLFIDMPPSSVDVNVHPAKLEVKFTDERAVFEAVYYTVKSALEEHQYRPEIELPEKRGFYNPAAAFVPLGNGKSGEQIALGTANPPIRERPAVSEMTDAPHRASADGFYDKPLRVSSGISGYTGAGKDAPTAYTSQKKDSGHSAPRTVTTEATLTPKQSIDLLDTYKRAEPISAVKQDSVLTEVSIEATPEYRIVGELFDCYVVVEYEGDVLIIDKHAAHERVIFEDLKRSYSKDGRVASQALLLPISVKLSPEELSGALEHKSEFSLVGFDFLQNGYSLDITAIPDAISAEGAEGLLLQMLDEIIKGVGTPENTEAVRRERALYQIACKAAIKGGRFYGEHVIKWLVEKLLALPEVIVCPHGRPVAYKLTKRELDRQFDRIK